MYFDLVTDQGVEHLKMPVNYEVENPGELLKSPTTYYENDTEKIEVFGSFKFYSNKRLGAVPVSIVEEILHVKF